MTPLEAGTQAILNVCYVTDHDALRCARACLTAAIEAISNFDSIDDMSDCSDEIIRRKLQQLFLGEEK